MSHARVIAPARKSLSAVSSARGYRIFDFGNPLSIIGERINPTGKKALQQELLEGKMNIVRQMAKDQEKQGADLLDVNIGVHGIDEVDTIRKVIHLLSTNTGLPLVIDSPNAGTMEAALRIYPGRALINSISGETAKMKKLFPIAQKYGAMFIILPIADNEIPETSERRQAIVKEVYGIAKKIGFSKDDIVVDGLVMTVASKPGAVKEALKTVAWCTDKFKCRTVLGLSNVSFGMPERKWLNIAFLAMAQASGLTMAIANPADKEFMNIKMAGNVFMQKDKDASLYIRHFSEGFDTEKETTPAEVVSPNQQVSEAILEGNREGIVELVERAIASGTSVSGLVNNVMIPAIIHVGELFDQRKYFLPQLIASAEAMKAALSHLEPRLQQDKKARKEKGVIILATVKGDIHDIGKNIIALMLKNHGYTIIDLGKDVQTEIVVKAIKNKKPDVVGLSALMTTTMVNMKEVVDLAKSKGYASPFIIGGAVVTKSYADSIGAAYAKDGVEAVRVIDQLIKTKKF
jgi:5-methyltetrahydrofolate--homocysteine methyltransferase